MLRFLVCEAHECDVDTVSRSAAHNSSDNHARACRSKFCCLMVSILTCSPNSHKMRESFSIFSGVGGGAARLSSRDFFLNASTWAVDSFTRRANLRSRSRSEEHTSELQSPC